jgi:PAS domain S-box-containing protein
MYYNHFSIPLVLVSIMMPVLAMITRRRRNSPDADYFSLLLLASAIYSLFYGLEISSRSLQLAMTFYKLQYLGIPFIPALYLLFAITYTTKSDIKKPYILGAILVIPVITLILAFTAGYHDLFISGGFLLDMEPFPIFVFDKEFMYWIHQAYTFFAIATGIFLLFRMLLVSPPAFRNQVAVVLAGSLLPFILYIFYILGVFPWGLDINPFSFAISGVFIFIGISRFRLFSLAPLARNMLFDSIPDGVVVLDRHFRLVDYNTRASEILKIYSHHIGSPAGEVLAKWPEILTYMTVREAGRKFEISRITENRALFLSCYFSRLSDERGVHRGQMLVLQNVTGQRKAEIEREETEEKFGVIFDNAPVGLMYFDKEGNIELCNEAFIKILDSSEDAIIGMNLSQITDERIINALKTTVQGKSAEFEGEYVPQTGKKSVYIRAVTKPVFSKYNIVEGGLCILEDITSRMAGEERIKQANSELKRLNAEKDKFFSILAHDLRSPFSAFLGFTDILAEGIDTMSPEILKSIGVSMKESANNLYSLLENLLQWSRMQQGSVGFFPEEFRLKKKVIESIEPLLINANNKLIDVTYEMTDDLTVYADAKMVETVIRNLFTNAIKFTRKEGSITISARETGNNFVETCFSDTGIGMSPEMVDNLFRLDVKSNRPGTDGELSTGLGLILCREFVEMNGGSIRVESQENKGSSFYIRLKRSANTKISK